MKKYTLECSTSCLLTKFVIALLIVLIEQCYFQNNIVSCLTTRTSHPNRYIKTNAFLSPILKNACFNKPRTKLQMSYSDKYDSISFISSSSYDEKTNDNLTMTDEHNDWEKQQEQNRLRTKAIDKILAEKELEDDENEKGGDSIDEDEEEEDMNGNVLHVKELEKVTKELEKTQGISVSILDPNILEDDDDSLVHESFDEDNKEETKTADVKNKKTISPRKGVRIGSSVQNWSLEVYPNDYIVHRKYGIGQYQGISTQIKTKLTEEEIEAQKKRRNQLVQYARYKKGWNKNQLQKLVNQFGTNKDKDAVSCPKVTTLNIAYADGIVNVPIERSYRITRYRAGDSKLKPRLSKVRGGEAWTKAKNNVVLSTMALAQDVLALYAKREAYVRTPYPPSNEKHMKPFEAKFPYTPTPDQISCFEAVENDMVYRTRPMDRLICGDVGFGKTEVALRALYRCVLDGRQAAFLSPTGVLAAQHYRNIQERFKDFHDIQHAFLRGGMGNHTTKGREVRAKIANGETKLIVGTHALISNSLEFHNLGLLVIDEEQRFGVAQKDRLKVLCDGIDVLTLTATPIPRTLQMSFSGIRDTSTIRSPPPERRPVETHVQPYQNNIIKYAIETELKRGGQIFYVVPRIAQLQEAKETIQDMFPDIKVVEAHGRMSRNGAEEAVANFAEGGADVLLATTVIENGVDIPNVNTIIVQNAQNFGMSTLYQLRGRVGRSNLQAYAYFLHKDEMLSDTSYQRLQAISDLTSLGCGFDVASRDLEIRGAGSLLGTEQSGMAAKVGFDLYMKMLKKSIRQLRGLLDLPSVVRTNVLLDNADVTQFHIPEDYITDPVERNQQEGAARLAENTNKIVQLTNQWKDAYGPLPPILQSQIKVLHLHSCTRILGIDIVGKPKDKEVIRLRVPGLRPRHWAMICQSFNSTSPPGVNIHFPKRFTGKYGKDVVIRGNAKVNVQTLLDLGSFAGTTSTNVDTSNPMSILEEEEDWDAFDREELEDNRAISSVAKVTSIDDVSDMNTYPRIVIPLPKKQVNEIDVILQRLLPVVQVMTNSIEGNKKKAKAAFELKEKREAIKLKKKMMKNEVLKKRNGYYY